MAYSWQVEGLSETKTPRAREELAFLPYADWVKAMEDRFVKELGYTHLTPEEMRLHLDEYPVEKRKQGIHPPPLQEQEPVDKRLTTPVYRKFWGGK